MPPEAMRAMMRCGPKRVPGGSGSRESSCTSISGARLPPSTEFIAPPRKGDPLRYTRIQEDVRLRIVTERMRMTEPLLRRTQKAFGAVILSREDGEGPVG